METQLNIGPSLSIQIGQPMHNDDSLKDDFPDKLDHGQRRMNIFKQNDPQIIAPCYTSYSFL